MAPLLDGLLNGHLQVAHIVEMADFFKGVRADFIKDGTLDPISMATDTQCLNYQIPGGMLSNLISQLKMMKGRRTPWGP